MSDIEYSFKSPRQQQFAFPQDVIRSMLENPSSYKGLLKLFQTCKNFYAKRPILIADDVNIVMDDKRFGNQVPTVNIVVNDDQDVTHLHTPIWLTKQIYVYGTCNQYQRLPKFFRYSVERIFLFNKALQFEDFLLLTSEKKLWYYSGNCVYHPDMSKATLDEILPHSPNIKRFAYFIDERCSAESLKKLNELKFNNKFVFLYLDIFDAHTSFDLDLFYEFIVKNCVDDTQLSLRLYSKAKKTLNAGLSKLDSKWQTEDRLGYTKLFLKNDIN